MSIIIIVYRMCRQCIYFPFVYPGSYDNYGCLLVWDSAMSKLKPTMDAAANRQLPFR